MKIRYWIELNEAERAQLTSMLSGGRHAVRKLKRARSKLARAYLDTTKESKAL